MLNVVMLSVVRLNVVVLSVVAPSETGRNQFNQIYLETYE
jgi:hypothetical protein